MPLFIFNRCLLLAGQKTKNGVHKPYGPCCTSVMDCRTGCGMECSEIFPDAMRYVSYRHMLHGCGIRAYISRLHDIVRETLYMTSDHRSLPVRRAWDRPLRHDPVWRGEGVRDSPAMVAVYTTVPSVACTATENSMRSPGRRGTPRVMGFSREIPENRSPVREMTVVPFRVIS